MCRACGSGGAAGDRSGAGGAREWRAARLLNVGTVTPRKGHALLIEALAGLRALSWDQVIVGNLDRDAGAAEHHSRARSAGMGWPTG